MFFWVSRFAGNCTYLNNFRLTSDFIKGLLLVPNGEDLGYRFGDFNPYEENSSFIPKPVVSHRSTAMDDSISDTKNEITPHPWGILFTILGTVLLDFDADACQSPARAYLLDVTIPGMIVIAL